MDVPRPKRTDDGGGGQEDGEIKTEAEMGCPAALLALPSTAAIICRASNGTTTENWKCH